MISRQLNETFADGGPHVTHVPLQSISRLAPLSALVIRIIFVKYKYFLLCYYPFERFLLQKVYSKIYTQMDDTIRRGFVNQMFWRLTYWEYYILMNLTE
jgi:hypothetical protein